MIFDEHSYRGDCSQGTHRKHTDTLPYNPAHKTHPHFKLEGPALQDNPAAHMRATHMLGGLLNVPLMGEKTQDTGRESNESETNTTGKKKSARLFFARRQMNVGVNRVMLETKKHRGRERERESVFRQLNCKWFSQVEQWWWISLLFMMHCLVSHLPMIPTKTLLDPIHRAPPFRRTTSSERFLHSSRNGGRTFYALHLNMVWKCSSSSLWLAKCFPGEVKAHFLLWGSISAECAILLHHCCYASTVT